MIQNIICIGLILVFCFSNCGKAKITLEQKAFKINSTYTNFDYDIKILYPEDYDPQQSYHVIYILDGKSYEQEFFNLVNDFYRKSIVLVSIDYSSENERDTDFTYPAHEKKFAFGGSIGHGGANKFIQYINHELIPHIENHLEIKPIERTLYGHSLGGYFALYMLFQQKHPNLFHNLISVSPSMYYADAHLFFLENEYAIQHDTLNHDLYLGMGDLEATAMYTSFVEVLEKRNYSEFMFSPQIIEKSGHNNTQLTALKNGIKFILK